MPASATAVAAPDKPVGAGVFAAAGAGPAVTSKMISSGNTAAATNAAAMALITAGSGLVEQDGADQPARAGAGQPEGDAVAARRAPGRGDGDPGGVDAQVRDRRGGGGGAVRPGDGPHLHEADQPAAAHLLPGGCRGLAGGQLPFQRRGGQRGTAGRVRVRPVVDRVHAGPRDV